MTTHVCPRCGHVCELHDGVVSAECAHCPARLHVRTRKVKESAPSLFDVEPQPEPRPTATVTDAGGRL